MLRFHWKWTDHELQPGEAHAGDVPRAHRRDGRRSPSADADEGAGLRHRRRRARSSTSSAACAWGAIPRRRSLNANCQAHDVQESLRRRGGPFVSQADKNPTWTIMALVLANQRLHRGSSARREPCERRMTRSRRVASTLARPSPPRGARVAGGPAASRRRSAEAAHSAAAPRAREAARPQFFTPPSCARSPCSPTTSSRATSAPAARPTPACRRTSTFSVPEAEDETQRRDARRARLARHRVPAALRRTRRGSPRPAHSRSSTTSRGRPRRASPSSATAPLLHRLPRPRRRRFFSSRMAWKDLRYQGNVPQPELEGCPEAALEKLGVSYA